MVSPSSPSCSASSDEREEHGYYTRRCICHPADEDTRNVPKSPRARRFPDQLHRDCPSRLMTHCRRTRPGSRRHRSACRVLADLDHGIATRPRQRPSAQPRSSPGNPRDAQKEGSVSVSHGASLIAWSCHRACRSLGWGVSEPGLSPHLMKSWPRYRSSEETSPTVPSRVRSGTSTSSRPCSSMAMLGPECVLLTGGVT